MIYTSVYTAFVGTLLLTLVSPSGSFTSMIPFGTPKFSPLTQPAITTLSAYNTEREQRSKSKSRKNDRFGPSNSYNGRSKRQERVGHLVRTEIASIVHLGYPIKFAEGGTILEGPLRKRINIVSVDVSPDLRHARVAVSVLDPPPTNDDEDNEEVDDSDENVIDDDPLGIKESSAKSNVIADQVVANSNDPVIDRRRAYSWLVRNTWQIRHALAQRLKHMKGIPELRFVQVDVGAAVDVMFLIEKVMEEDYKRTDIEDLFEEGGVRVVDGGGSGDDNDVDDDGWVDEDEDDWFDGDDGF